MSDHRSSLAALVDELRRRTGAPGARVAVGVRGTVVDGAATGFDDPSSGVPLGGDGSFRVGSVTKTFTAALVLGLCSTGAIALADPVAQWVPEFPGAGNITVEDLLGHVAGLGDPILDAFEEYVGLLLADLERDHTPAELLSFDASSPPVAAPGDRYRYTNTEFHLLGALIERVTGTDFAGALEAAVTVPLGLDHTRYSTGSICDLAAAWCDIGSDGSLDASRVRDLDASKLPNVALVSLAFSAGGITSNLADLVRWGDALYHGDALAAPMRDLMLASPVHPDPENGGVAGLGIFGFGAPDTDGRFEAYGHCGNIVGSSCVLAAFPRTRVTVVAHANVLEVPAALLVDLARACARRVAPHG
jgi:D-alanyl-D-alanine carboxypeptidase